MESLKSKIYKAVLRLTNSKNKIVKEFKKGVFDKRDCPNPTKELFSKFRVERCHVGNRNVFTVKPKSTLSGKYILYLHGGAFVHNMAKQHWGFVRKLVSKTNFNVIVPDYPLAPTYTYRDSFEMIESVYEQLLQTTNESDIILMGDSAGGGFALSFAQYLRNHNKPQPSQIILLSPWLDLSLSNPEIEELNSKDPFLGVEGLKLAAQVYAGDTDLSYYQLSPIYGGLECLGEISLFTGTHDILHADAEKLKFYAADDLVKVNYFEYPKMIHVWMLLDMPEAEQVLNQIVELLKKY